ncbi:MAG: NAD(P)H-dependent glycerol-3-phosphate dehydrogenase [bacterium]
MKTAVIGAGAWGTTLASLLASKGNDVVIWALEKELVDSINNHHENSLYLKDIPLSENLTATNDFSIAVDGTDLLLFAVPSQWMRSTCRLFAQSVSTTTPVITVTKGLEISTGTRMSEIIKEELPDITNIAALSGPNLAPEIALGKPAATVIASADVNFAIQLQEHFQTAYFRPYTSNDIIGLEICGAVKNVIAIAAGICEGLGFGDNTKAALLTRAATEICRLVKRMGGRPETVYGLSGIGDIMATCSSPMSRNHRVGLTVGKGDSYLTALGNSGQVAEGVPTTEAVVKLARNIDVVMPICEEVYAMLFENKPAPESFKTLMSRNRGKEYEWTN